MTATCQYLEAVEHYERLYCGRPAVARYSWPDGSRVHYACPRHDSEKARRWAAAHGVERSELRVAA